MGLKEILHNLGNLMGDKPSTPVLQQTKDMQNTGNLEERIEQYKIQKAREAERIRLMHQKELEESEREYKKIIEKQKKLAEKYTIPLAEEFNKIKPFNGMGVITSSIKPEKIDTELRLFTYKTDSVEAGYFLQFRVFNQVWMLGDDARNPNKETNRLKLSIEPKLIYQKDDDSSDIFLDEPDWKRKAEDLVIALLVNDRCRFYHDESSSLNA